VSGPSPAREVQRAEVVVVGAGAAGLAASIFAARRLGPGRVVLLDSARVPGAKILVSGGGRCNVTNREVSERDFWGGPPHLVKRVLRAFGAQDTVAFFRELGVKLHEEEHGKLFPDTHKARTVLDALLVEAARRGVELRAPARVDGMERAASGEGLIVRAESVTLQASRVVLATGGLSLPKTGSDGGGYRLARSVGHSVIATTPGLVPLVLGGTWHAGLSGVSEEVELRLLAEGQRPRPIAGSLLWTHFGASGPAVLEVSRHLLRAHLEGRGARLLVNQLPGEDGSRLDRDLVEAARRRPRAGVKAFLEGRLPTAILDATLREVGLAPSLPLGQAPREQRRRFVAALVSRELEVVDSRGYNFAEVTAGGVPLEEVDLRTMESKLCPGLHLVGEILDVDGRLGGFNFQWAWSSAFVAALGVAAAFRAVIIPAAASAEPCP
jgi:predicted Rossmann fold flavoprotein